MPQVFTVSEAARRVGVSEGTIRKLADEGKLPATRSERGTRFFHREDLDKLQEQRGRERTK
jgi:excisionase family DNA binding protein